MKDGNEARQLNAHLDALTSKVYKLEREMIQDGKRITFESFREKRLGITETPPRADGNLSTA